MMFAGREEAGKRLAASLAGVPAPGALVLGIPRGGVIVAREVASTLALPLDVVVPHKLGAPSNSELAIGGVTLDGTVVVDEQAAAMLHVDDAYLAGEIQRQRSEIARRLLIYRGAGDEADPAGRVCIVVDDGMATGSTAEAAVRSLQKRGAARVILAVPVAPRQAIERMTGVADEVVCLATPEPFLAVGQWYLDFGQVTDDEVIAALRG